MVKLQARDSVLSISGSRRRVRPQLHLRGLRPRAEVHGRPVFRPQGLVPRNPAARVTLVALGLGAPAGAALLQRRRAARERFRPLAERFTVAIGQHPLIAPSLAAGAAGLTGGYLFLRRRRAARRVRDAMTPNPRAAEPSTLLIEAAELMKSKDIDVLPVVQDERLVGVLTNRDIVERVVAEGRDPQSVHVGDIVSRELVTADPDQPLDEALRLMAHRHVRRVPVVEGERLVGILSQADVALVSEEQRIGEAARRIPEPSAEPGTSR